MTDKKARKNEELKAEASNDDYNYLKASLQIIEKLKKAENSGTIRLSEAKKKFGL